VLCESGWEMAADLSELRRMPVSGGASEPVLTARNGEDNIGRCSVAPATLCVLAEETPDNKQLIFTAFHPMKGRRAELLRVDTDPAAIYEWALSPDGTRIAVLTPNERTGTHFASGWTLERRNRAEELYLRSTIRQQRVRPFRIWICTGILTWCGRRRHRLERVESRHLG
jgi:hypothetical protein